MISIATSLDSGSVRERLIMTRVQTENDVLEAILEFNAGRKPKLLRLKLRRMLSDPFTFFRGTDHLFARAWPELRPAEVGPDVLLCGDLHLENFGAFKTADGNFRFDINDFDEAAVAPCSVDLVRCTTSIFLAAEQWLLTPTEATGMALAFLEHYRQGILQSTTEGTVGEVCLGSGEGPIWKLLGSTVISTHDELLKRKTKRKSGDRCIIERAKNHPPVSRSRFEAIRNAFEAYGLREGEPDRFRVRDATVRIAGVGSLGVRRYLALIEGDGPPDGYRLIDIKEALPSAILSCRTAPQPEWDEARRIVDAQRALQGHPAAGLDVLHISGRTYRIRDMIPHENRASLDRLSRRPAKLRQGVETAGLLTAWSHLRGARLTPDRDCWPELAHWCTGAAIDAVLAAAARYADRTNREHHEFRQGVRSAGGLARLDQRTAVGTRNGEKSDQEANDDESD